MKAKPLGAVDDAEAELARARVAVEDVAAKVRRGDSTVTAADLHAAHHLVEYCELRLEGAHQAEADAAESARRDRIAEIVADLQQDRYASLAVRLVGLHAAHRQAVEELYAAAEEYIAGTAGHVAELHRLGYEGVSSVGNGPKSATIGDATYAPDRDMPLALAMAGIAESAAKRKAPAIGERRWRDWVGAAETTWRKLRSAHPAVADQLPATPRLDAGRVVRLEELEQRRQAEGRQRLRAAVREAELAESLWHEEGRDQPALDLVKAGVWPDGRPMPWDVPVADDADAAVPVARPRRSRVGVAAGAL